MCCAYIVELWGVYARNLGFQAVEVNVDSLVVVNCINGNGHGSPSGRSLVFEIQRLINLDWKIVVKHSYREGNQCADALANFRCSLTGEITFFESCPAQFSHLLAADVIGISIPCLIPI